MTEEDLRIECLRLEIPAEGLDKSALQRQLLRHVVARATSTPASQTRAPPVYAAVKTDQLGQDREDLDLEDLNLEESDHEEEYREKQDQDLQKTLYSPPRQGDSILHPRGVQNVAPADQSSGVIRFRQDRPRQAETKPPAPSRTMPQFSDISDVQLQLRRLELEHAREERQQQLEHELEIRKLELQQGERQRERECQKDERQLQLEHKKLELELSRTSNPSAQPADLPASWPPPFRVEAAVKLVPKFSESDVETFLISFEKVAELNNFPPDKYAAILQAHLTGKALKVFTELSVEECRDYPTLKAALLQAYSVVPEVYRKRFRNLSRLHTETYSEFAFRLSTQFIRWLES